MRADAKYIFWQLRSLLKVIKVIIKLNHYEHNDSISQSSKMTVWEELNVLCKPFYLCFGYQVPIVHCFANRAATVRIRLSKLVVLTTLTMKMSCRDWLHWVRHSYILKYRIEQYYMDIMTKVILVQFFSSDLFFILFQELFLLLWQLQRIFSLCWYPLLFLQNVWKVGPVYL